MATVKEHYDSHLAPVYTWMSGGAAGARRRFATLLQELKLQPSHGGATALDLGAGSGFQAIPLADAGYAVTAVDLSAVLLDELMREAGPRSIRTLCDDFREFSRCCPTPAPEVIVCMGDTLSHLRTLEETRGVLHEAANALSAGGHLLLSFRDYTSERTGQDRFIPVRSDADRIFTCFLEYGPERVAVHDIVHTRAGSEWRTTISVYEKIRLRPAWVRDQLTVADLVIVKDTLQNGLATLVARRSNHS
jgi:SAM-dependent methyltransferase